MCQKIIFLNIELNGFNSWDAGESLGLEYLSAVLRNQGYKVTIINIPYNVNMESLENIIALNPLLLGFTLPCTFKERFSFIGNKLKQSLPSTHITCGNRYATDNSIDLLKEYWWLDSVVRGEGEETIVELARRLECKIDLKGCLGIYYKENGKVIRNLDRPLIKNLDTLPFPVKDMLLRTDSQFTWICASRGCVNNCTFCNSNFNDIQKGKALRLRSINNVVNEIVEVYYNTGCSKFAFVDSSYEEPGKKGKERIRGIAQELLKRNIKIHYGAYFSAHNWSYADLDLLKLLKKSGMIYAYVGFESGSEMGLKTFNKRATLGNNYMIIKLLNDAGIALKCGFIMFHPYLTVKEFLENNEFLYTSGIGNFLGLYYNELSPYKGTPIYKRLETENLLTGKVDPELGHYKWIFSDTLCEQLYQFYQKLRDNEYIIKIATPELEYKVTELLSIYMDQTDNRLNTIYSKFNKEMTEIRRQLCELNYNLANKLVEIITNDSSDTKKQLRILKERYLTEVCPFVDLLEKKTFSFLFQIKKAGIYNT